METREWKVPMICGPTNMLSTVVISTVSFAGTSTYRYCPLVYIFSGSPDLVEIMISETCKL